ncbi:MAG: twin-arginine translocation signal domain-containing protein, partial [Acidobacteriota bacterium]|nr:twin-arginine translocation signal domain-containing protein [Acidobacteriota bacterium]
MTQDASSPEQEFHTWGEIASYLGISIREAQNREKSDGLPVRRIGEGKKPRVFALRSELDAWKLAASGAVAAPVPAAAPRKPWTRRAVLGAAGVAVAGVGAGLYFTHRRPRIERAVLTGNLLTAIDALGRSVWEHRFSEDLVQHDPVAEPWRVQVLDLEGAGAPGVVVVCSRATPGSPVPAHAELVYLGPEG